MCLIIMIMLVIVVIIRAVKNVENPVEAFCGADLPRFITMFLSCFDFPAFYTEILVEDELSKASTKLRENFYSECEKFGGKPKKLKMHIISYYILYSNNRQPEKMNRRLVINGGFAVMLFYGLMISFSSAMLRERL